MSTATKKVELSTRNLEWYYKNYGTNASISWILDLLLTRFREAQTLTPSDYADIAARQLDKDIKDELV